MSAESPLQTPWLTPPIAAAYLGVALGTLRNWTSMRFVPHVKRGRLVRYNRLDLDRWLAAGARPGRATKANKI
ncbi:MAG: helix-turn-helix domain-containing protein [Gemmataceae bacterium]|jgi:excisionase family DNA binding protein